MAMPPPMVPAPMMPTCEIFRNWVSAGTSGIFDAARSEINRCRSDTLSGVDIRAVKISRSAFIPSSNFILVAFCTASTHLAGAGKFFAIAVTVLSANLKYPSASGCPTRRSRTKGSGPTAAFSSAYAIAPAMRSPSITLSNSFCPGKLAINSLLTGSPDTIMLSAASTPITRGKRCVPPAPGIKPSLTSGSAMLAPAEVTR